MRAFAYHRATSVGDALAAQQGDPATHYLAGGTTLIDLVKLDVMRPARLVDVNRLAIDGIEITAEGDLRIGANVRNSDLAWHPEVKRRYPVVSEALLSGASGQIRNMATTAGNLMQRTRCPYFRDNVSACNKREPGTGCAAREGYARMHAILGGSDACIATHPSDLCVALAALDAALVVASPRGERTIALKDFHLLPAATPEREHALEPDELITSVTLPPPIENARSHYLKVRDRDSFEFALASAAVVIAVEAGRIRIARVALGGVGTKPWRSPAAEAVLEGAPAVEATFEAAAEAALRGAQPQRDNAFKVTLARRTLQRALATVTAPALDLSTPSTLP